MKALRVTWRNGPETLHFIKDSDYNQDDLPGTLSKYLYGKAAMVGRKPDFVKITVKEAVYDRHQWIEERGERISWWIAGW